MNTKERPWTSLLCLVGIGMMGMVSYNELTLNEDPIAVENTTKIGGYPDVQATINASIDKALALVDAAAERSVEPDHRYATLSRALRRERDGEWATERVLDPARTDELTEEERAEIDSLIADDSELDAAFAELADELEAVYAAIPTIEIKVQELDENDEPIGEPYIIQSENGVIEFGDRTITSEEFSIPALRRPTEAGCGGCFTEHSTQPPSGSQNTPIQSSRRYTWNRGSSPYLRISRAELGSTRGTATLGKVSKSFLRMDHGVGRTDRGEGDFYHEVGHVLGLIHEHQRYDRDRYVIMSPYKAYYDANYARIRERRRQQFWFLWWSWYSWVDNSTTYGTPYDYHSVMHYPAEDHTTIRLPDRRSWDVSERNKSVWGAENHYTYFTPWDIYSIKRRYGITPNPRPGYTPGPAYPS